MGFLEHTASPCRFAQGVFRSESMGRIGCGATPDAPGWIKAKVRDSAKKAPLFQTKFRGRTLKVVKRQDRSPLLILYEVGPEDTMVQRLQVGLRHFGDPNTEAGVVSFSHLQIVPVSFQRHIRAWSGVGFCLGHSRPELLSRGARRARPSV